VEVIHLGKDLLWRGGQHGAPLQPKGRGLHRHDDGQQAKNDNNRAKM
jgi:hypothetical protein